MTGLGVDKIIIRDLLLRTVIGVNPEERGVKQDVLLNLELSCALAKAGASDRLEDTVDYKSLKWSVINFVEGSSFQLLEALAEGVARLCLEPALVEEVKVTVDKPGALRFARSVAVELSRRKARG